MKAGRGNEVIVLYYARQVIANAAPQTTDVIVNKYRAPRTPTNSGQKEIFVRDMAPPALLVASHGST